MLKRDALPWGPQQTKFVCRLKEILHLPPLQIPSMRKRVLQIYAKDEYWATIRFEKKKI